METRPIHPLSDDQNNGGVLNSRPIKMYCLALQDFQPPKILHILDRMAGRDLKSVAKNYHHVG